MATLMIDMYADLPLRATYIQVAPADHCPLASIILMAELRTQCVGSWAGKRSSSRRLLLLSTGELVTGYFMETFSPIDRITRRILQGRVRFGSIGAKEPRTFPRMDHRQEGQGILFWNSKYTKSGLLHGDKESF